jgi:uncharacterized repeat protein (TIGR03803 family)
MNTGSSCKKWFILPVLIAALDLMPAGRLTAQTFTVLHNFTAISACCPATNSDGANPYGGLALAVNTLYGTTQFGGSSGSNGTVFKLNIDGTGFTTLHSFTPTSGSYPYTNSDGGFPSASLILSGNTLYGTAEDGGSSGRGTIFTVNTDGTSFTTVYNFGVSDGLATKAGLILSDNTLYGTADLAGGSERGSVFKVNTDGTGFTNLYDFTGGRDGDRPQAGLILSSNTLFGTTLEGGSSGEGTVFALNTDGTGFTTLYSFTAASCCPNINSDGIYPIAGTALSGNKLYGTASIGGTSGNGTVFKVNTDGTGFTTLHSFTGADGSTIGPVILSGNTLYGATVGGGSSGSGTVFTVNTDGTGFTTLYSFTALNNNTNSDGAYPWGRLILSGHTLYGTAVAGGSSGNGTVFSISLAVSPPQLTITPAEASVVLTWPTNATGFTLQSATNLISPAWTTNLPAPAVINGTNTVTALISGTQQFFRLSQ